MDTVATPLPINPPSRSRVFWTSFGHALLIGVGHAAVTIALTYAQKFAAEQAGNLITSFTTTNGGGDAKI